MVFRITTHHFTAGCADGVCAPIIKYMERWSISKIRSYCASKGWKLEIYETGNCARELVSGNLSLDLQGEKMNGFGNNNQDYSNIFTGIAKAKSMGGGGYAERLGIGRHRVALKSYKVKESTKGAGNFLEAEFVVLESNTHEAGESRGWVWFINAAGPWAPAYEQDRAKKFLEAVGACVGDDSPVEVIGGNLAGPAQAGKGLILEVTVSPQTGKNAGKTNARGEPYTNIYWKPVAQTLEQLAEQRAEIEAMEGVSAQQEPAPAPVQEARPVATQTQAAPKRGLGLLGNK